MSKDSNTMSLVAAEPYRVFFPAALLMGVIGVMLWPLFYWGQLSYYPMFSHARLMIEGFVGGFAVGFLGTALPRMLSAKALRPVQIVILGLVYLACCGLHMAGLTRMGDAGFALLMLLMLCFVMIRVIRGKSVPPPGIILAGLGIACGVFGAVWSAALGLTGDLGWTTFSQRLLYQAFILLPLLGIGGYIFPMVLGTHNKHAMLSGSKASKAWVGKASEAALLGLLLIATYWVEAKMIAAGKMGDTRMMSAVRLLLCLFWLTRESGWLSRKKTGGVMPFALRAGIVCLLGNMLLTAIIYQHRIALEHTLYIGGFGLITMIVATRVIYGHSGQGAKFQKWIKPLLWCVGLLLLGMATRVTADFMPKIKISHHIYAAACWVVVSIIWGVAVIPSVRRRPFPGTRIGKHPADKPSVLTMNFRK